MKKDKLIVTIPYPKKDLSGWEYDNKEIIVHTEFNPLNNTFRFSTTIPEFVWQVLESIKPKKDDVVKSENKTAYERQIEFNKQLNVRQVGFDGFTDFKRKLSEGHLSILLDSLSKAFIQAMTIQERETAQEEKYIAIRFTQSNARQRDDFNHAYMGLKTMSSFQFFIVFKTIRKEGSLDRYIFKSDTNLTGGDFSSSKTRKWHWFGVGSIERGGYTLIKWTQEREDFLDKIQEKFVEMNTKLDDFLGNIDDDKITQLMSNSNLFLGNGLNI